HAWWNGCRVGDCSHTQGRPCDRQRPATLSVVKVSHRVVLPRRSWGSRGGLSTAPLIAFAASLLGPGSEAVVGRKVEALEALRAQVGVSGAGRSTPHKRGRITQCAGRNGQV